ncbi:unnamed protein product (macronuclear) [Paramecium tetraurelia]|uniref:Translation initiation factor IF2/IF5 domain-containing protein n=1 Tax=Paramecium tetraurelia TaxID=5888 RepID=A0EDN0_PARTE|nr:uncharacterized protein GSPATT00025741001 [Paramecium tetraurelia]CAK93397.1 unnamed protein product [Paramecium tetraurelia]|eukprot:XP_001460794.1 hypothetical protein (macronuclear) [Paramecium tetraurelia strain d4-2]
MDIIDFNKPNTVKKVKVVKKVVTQAPVVNKQQQNKDYYNKALERIIQLLKENNPSLATQTNIQLEKPQIDKLGTKKTLWKNFDAICVQMNRYFLIELGTEGSQADEKLIIKGRYTSTQIETLIKKYLYEYVLCSLCKSSDTTLIRDVESRLYSKECKNCKATKTVATLKISNKRQK